MTRFNGILPVRRALLLVATLSLLNLVACGFEQTYTVSGVIIDDSGEPLSGVKIQLIGDSRLSSATSGNDGRWTKSDLVGPVTVAPAKTGYSFEPSSVDVTAAKTILFAATYDPFHNVHGLYVSDNGTLMYKGQEFRGMGVNYFDVFSRTLHNPYDTSYIQGFATLAQYNIPFVRFMAGGFWPIHWRLYQEDKETYFQLLDNIVETAEYYGVGLIPSLFWHNATFPDLMDESRNAWGDPNSATHQFMRTYVAEVVTRYKDSPAIWGWEFGNEYNLVMDYPQPELHRPTIQPHLGTRLERTDQDDLSSAMVHIAFKEFGEQVRRYDPHRIIINGNSAPRPSAWHQKHHGTWTRDSEEQLAEVLIADNPDPINVISVHAYGASYDRFNRTVPVQEFFAELMSIAESVQKPLFLGEFGTDRDLEVEEEQFFAVINAIEATGIPLSAIWVFNYVGQDPAQYMHRNITATNQRLYQLEELQRVNLHFRSL